MSHDNWSPVSNIHSGYSDVTKYHGSYQGGRHRLGYEYGKITRIRLGDHVRIGGVCNITERNNWGNVTL